MSKKKKKEKKVKKAKRKTVNHNIVLKVANKKDFLELDKIKDGKKIWKPKFGIPFWLYNSKGVIENKNYILSDDSDLEAFKQYLILEQVLILK